MRTLFHLFHRSQKAQLGPLEEQLLEALWQRRNATVREVIEHCNLDLAYTTVMTTLDRLYKKGVLQRVSEGRAFRYSPICTRSEMEKALAGETIRQLLGSTETASQPLSYLVEAVSEHDSRLLDDLQRLLDEKRRELKREGQI